MDNAPSRSRSTICAPMRFSASSPRSLSPTLGAGRGNGDRRFARAPIVETASAIPTAARDRRSTEPSATCRFAARPVRNAPQRRMENFPRPDVNSWRSWASSGRKNRDVCRLNQMRPNKLGRRWPSAEIARQRAAADQLTQSIAAEVEAMILGGQPPPDSSLRAIPLRHQPPHRVRLLRIRQRQRSNHPQCRRERIRLVRQRPRLAHNRAIGLARNGPFDHFTALIFR